MIAMRVVDKKGVKSLDSYSDIANQSINYGTSVIGGMVSQYRQELLRRRNFCLILPFGGQMDTDALNALKEETFNKRALMHCWSLRFRNPEVNECFYRY